MIIALFAIDETGGMGFDGSMPWPRNKEDMQWFKTITTTQIVAMGRKTWDSSDMPVPLPNRINVLVTSNFLEREDIIQLNGDVCEGLLAIQNSYPNKNIYVIGGPNLLMQAIPVLDKAYITRIPGEYISDAVINIEEFLSRFKLVTTQQFNTCKVEEYEAIQTGT